MKCTFLLLILHFGLHGSAGSQARIDVVGGPSVRFTNMYSGQVARRTLTLRNTGNDTLVIGQIESSCGCTVPHIASQHIASKGSTTLSIQFNSQFYEGRVNKEITINSNDQTMPRLLIRVEAEVTALIDISTHLIKFGRVKVGSVAAETVAVSNMVEDTIRLLPVKSSNPKFTVKLLNAVLPPLRKTQLVVILRPKQPGYFSTELELKTDKKWNVSYKIGGLAHVVP